ncbi:MAG: archaemetzincin family Zn-dependent metalloprotease [Candidatus Diapherotrites archaeon]|nr:archaemetzincin family Zn-dependent metalloprotease [Candidatus Diapherotrites archaeon]
MRCLVVLFDELSLVNKLKSVLEKGFKFEVEIIRAKKPECLARENQLNASDFLGELSIIRRKHACDIAIGLTASDLFYRDLNFVFGLASFATKCCIVSWYRLRQAEQLFFKRLVKECLHELGHVLGLQHCQNKQCVMSFSNSLAEVDEKQAAYCSNCAEQIAKYLRV